MKARLLGLVAAASVAFILMVPVVLAAQTVDQPGRILVSVRGDVTLPAGEEADVVVVVDGVATISGDVNRLVTINGSAVVSGARVVSIVAVGSDVQLNAGTVVTGDVMTVDSQVHQAGDATVLGEMTDLRASLIAVGAVLAPAFLLFWIGMGLAMIVAGLLLAGLASRQVRMAERAIVREPVLTLVVGLVGLILIPVAAIALMITIIGAPLGLGVLFQLWPLIAFVGYLVAGIWIGEWIQARIWPGVVHERPYVAAILGILVLQSTSLVPVLGIVSVVASLFGFGAVLLVAWRTLTSRPGVVAPVAGPVPAPVAG